MPPLRHFALAVTLLAPFVSAQQTPTLHDKTPKDEAPQDKAATLSVAARLVNLPVIVRDKKGAIVTTLTKTDFNLQVDGHPQTIRYFDRDANLPLTLGLLVDTSQSQRDVIEQERTASGSFLDQMLTAPSGRPADQAFVIQFARETELLQDLTPSRPKLQAALKQIDTTPDNSNQQSQSDPNDPNDTGSNSGGHGGRRGGRGGGTTLYDAVFLSSDELMAKQKGRKALIILSDGVDNGSKENLAHSIETAQRADAIIYAIYFKGEEHNGGGGGNRGGGFPGGRGGGIGFPGGGYPGGGGGRGGGGGNRGGGNENRVDGKKILERMAHETGGRLFEVTKKQTVDQIYTQIAEELRSQYRLGYTPDEATAADGYHQVDLTVPNQKNLNVQTRDGYYTGK
ncbi:VWA domain-containing protein [Granulicella sibirica]|uniref:von Willebrand factor, type A n=1 Tax=Granulicella sibirica TaxID=2479048 RepID=A0A4Q0T7Q9_9BACT|nr:VWA domain-containing protein [Granulicella sibirica]RXH57641.1 von Willebrand factor, type A [Granulicella sibirica]